MSDPALLAFLQETARLITTGDLAAAEERLAAFVAARPDVAEGWHQLAITLQRAGRPGHALAFAERATELAPEDPFALNTLGVIRNALQRYAQAIAPLTEATRLKPDLVGAWSNLGNALAATGALDAALEAAERAAKLDPGRADVFVNLGNLCKEQGRSAAAIAAYGRAIDLEPAHALAQSNRLALLKASDAHEDPFVFRAHRAVGRQLESLHRVHREAFDRSTDPDRTLNIGYVSPDCHTAVPAFIAPVLSAHDAVGFRIFCYYNNPQPKPPASGPGTGVTRRVMAGATDDQVYAQIRADAIDVLVDIAGHTGRNRLAVFARRAAPVQMTWLDYLGTTGIESIDYRITDSRADPPGMTEALHTERLLRLPDTQWCWQPPAAAPEVSALPARVHGRIAFGSFNNATKLGDRVLDLWARVLVAIPSATLLLVGVHAGRASERVLAPFDAAGVAERVECLPRVDLAQYRALFGRIDIALDPFPFSGATTTLDALWQGVPVLTCPQRRSCSRSSASLLGALGLDEWIAADADDFVARARHLAADFDALGRMRAGLRERVRRSPLCDARGFTRALEGLYREAWRHWCATRAPADVARAPGNDRAAELSLRAALQSARSGDLEGAIRRTATVLHGDPGWRLAQSTFVSLAMAWGRANRATLEPLIPPVCLRTHAPLVSVVVCSIDPKKFAAVEASYGLALADGPWELIGIHDARSLAEGFNRGAARARGEILVFSHDDIELASPQLHARLGAHLEAFDMVGVAGTDRLVDANWGRAGTPHVHGQIIHRPPDGPGLLYLAVGMGAPVAAGIQGLDGVFTAVRRPVWEKLRYDDETFDGFHGYDVDFSFRAHRAGYRIAVPLDLMVVHASMGRYDRVWAAYNRRFLARHAGALAEDPLVVPGALQCRIEGIDQAWLLRAVLMHFGFGRAGAPGGAGGSAQPGGGISAA